jgi:long-chain fatty acid transport protein
VQGKKLPGYYYETFRVIGFPAIVEHHVTLGVTYEFTPTFSANLGYVHGFEETFKESGTDFAGASKIESTLSEDSIDFGLTWRF